MAESTTTYSVNNIRDRFLQHVLPYSATGSWRMHSAASLTL